MSEPLIYKALLAVQSEVGHIAKTQSVMNFKTRGVEQFLAKFHRLFDKHGIIVRVVPVGKPEYTFNGKQVHCSLTHEYHFTAADGSTFVCAHPGEGLDTSDKATGKASSYAYKYCLIQMFNIPTEDVADADHEHVERAPAEQRPAVYKHGRADWPHVVKAARKLGLDVSTADSQQWLKEWAAKMDGSPIESLEPALRTELEDK